MTGENNYLEFNTYTRHTSFSVCRQEIQQWYYSSDPAKLDITIQLWEFCMHVYIRRGKWNYNSVGKGWADLVKKFDWGEKRWRDREKDSGRKRERKREEDTEIERMKLAVFASGEWKTTSLSSWLNLIQSPIRQDSTWYIEASGNVNFNKDGDKGLHNTQD